MQSKALRALRNPQLARRLQEKGREQRTKKESSVPWTRNYPIAIASGISVLLFGLVGAAAISGVMPSEISRQNPHATPLVDTTAFAAAARKANCRNCGVVSSVRPIEVIAAEAKTKGYRVTVRMDDGSERSVSLAAQPGFGIGARVRINGSALERG
jgi:hypothetical protein